MEVQVIRSRNRKRTISARLINDILVVYLPDRMTATEEQRWIDHMRRKLVDKKQRQAQRGESELTQRANLLNRRYFGGQLRFTSIRYVTNQEHRFGSCSPAEGTIRLSHRIAQMPMFVRDYVIVHELAHLLEPNHSKRFWALVKRYPLAERAIGYLMGWSVQVEGNPARPNCGEDAA